MPKLKSHSGAKKRFNLTKNGKVKRAHAFKSHILTKKDTKRCRRLRSTTYADATTEATIRTTFRTDGSQMHLFQVPSPLPHNPVSQRYLPSGIN